MKQILLVEDDPMIGQTLVLSLPYRGYDLKVAESAARASALLDNMIFDLILLDVQLPDGSGFDLCRIIRDKDRLIPILMLSARTDEPSVVKGLSLGADDYIRKPFGLGELTARMDRLVGRKLLHENILSYRMITIDQSGRTVHVDGQLIHLGKREYVILSFLVKRGGEVVTREEILDALSDDAEMFDRTIDSHLSHLRKKIREIAGNRIRIQPIYGVGYRLEAGDEPL
ncbi:MAG: response regulator transcription factor [Leptospirillum sp.]